MLLKKGNKTLVVHRRLFESDRSRYFIGVVQAYDKGLVKVDGHTWTKDPHTTVIVKKEGSRTKIISLFSGALLVYQLPSSVDLSSVKFENDPEGKLVLKDKKGFFLDLSETSHGES